MARRPKEAEPLDLDAIFQQMGEALQKVESRPNLLNYKPHEKQSQFHESQKKERLFIGGNRSGKSVAGTVEAIKWLTKRHEHRNLPSGPIRGRIITVDLLEGLEQIILPLVSQWIPPSELIDGSWERSYSRSRRELRLRNDSTCDFLTYEQDVEKHAGTSRHFVWMDEEPPWEIFEENMMRLVDTDGEFWITMTPLLGMTWVYDKLYLPGIQGTDPHIEVIEVHSGDNPHLQQKARGRLLRLMDKDTVSAREEGKFVELGGLIFKQFDKDKHVIKTDDPRLVNGIPPRNWQWYMSLDSGWNNPTAIYWHAVSPEGLVITFGEHYKSEMTVHQHAEVIKAKEFAWGRRADIRTGDPATKQTREATGTSVQQEYAMNEIYLALDSVPTGPGSVAVGIPIMQRYLQSGNWLIVEDCPNLIHELQRLHWEVYQSKKLASRTNPQEKVAKKDDHGFDSCRYFFTLMPDLTPENPAVIRKELLENQKGIRYDEALVKMQQLREEGTLVDAIGDVDFQHSNEYTTWYSA